MEVVIWLAILAVLGSILHKLNQVTEIYVRFTPKVEEPPKPEQIESVTPEKRIEK
jgi:hypothetical protein